MHTLIYIMVVSFNSLPRNSGSRPISIKIYLLVRPLSLSFSLCPSLPSSFPPSLLLSYPTTCEQRNPSLSHTHTNSLPARSLFPCLFLTLPQRAGVVPSFSFSFHCGSLLLALPPSPPLSIPPPLSLALPPPQRASVVHPHRTTPDTLRILTHTHTHTHPHTQTDTQTNTNTHIHTYTRHKMFVYVQRWVHACLYMYKAKHRMTLSTLHILTKHNLRCRHRHWHRNRRRRRHRCKYRRAYVHKYAQHTDILIYMFRKR